MPNLSEQQMTNLFIATNMTHIATRKHAKKKEEYRINKELIKRMAPKNIPKIKNIKEVRFIAD